MKPKEIHMSKTPLPLAEVSIGLSLNRVVHLLAGCSLQHTTQAYLASECMLCRCAKE